MSSSRSRRRSAAPDRGRGLVSFSLAAALLVSPSSGFAAPSPARAQADAPTQADTPDASEPAPTSEVEPAPDPDPAPAVDPEPPPPEVAPLPEHAPIPETDEDVDEDIGDDVDRDDDTSFEDDYDILRDSPEGRTARRWLNAGIAATITGTVLVGGAVAYGLADPCSPAAGNNCFTDARNRGAASMGVPGGVLLLGGVAMTVVGALQRRRLQRGLAPGVAVVPTGTGVLLVGQF